MCWWETRDASRLTRFANNRADCMDFFSRENLCSCVDRNSSVLCAFEGRGLIRNCGPFLQSPLVCLSVPTPLSIWGGGNCAGSTQVCTHTHTHTHTHTAEQLYWPHRVCTRFGPREFQASTFLFLQINALSLVLTALLPKLPMLDGVRICGINKY